MIALITSECSIKASQEVANQEIAVEDTRLRPCCWRSGRHTQCFSIARNRGLEDDGNPLRFRTLLDRGLHHGCDGLLKVTTAGEPVQVFKFHWGFVRMEQSICELLNRAIFILRVGTG